MKWLSRNWPLAIAGGIIALMIIKKIISNVSLPPIEKISGIEGLLGGLDVIYIRLLAVGIIVAIYFGNKFIKGIGLVALTLIVLQSGIGDWGETVVKGTDKWFSCQAKPEQAKCLKEKKVVVPNYVPAQPQALPRPIETEVKPPPKAHTEPCTDKWHKDLDGCQEVTFQGEAVHEMETKKDKCQFWDLGSAFDDLNMDSKHIFSLKKEYRDKVAIMSRFFYVPIGQKYKGVICKK